MTDSPKVEPPKDEVRDKIENLLVKVRKFEITEETAIQITFAIIKLQQEALLAKLEAELPFEFKTDGETEYFKGAKWGRNQTINTVKTTINKLKLEL